MMVSREPAHADRIDEILLEAGRAPSGRSVRTRHDDPTARFRLVSRIEHDPAVGQLDRDRLVRVDELACARNCNLTGLPRLAGVVAENRGSHAWTMRIAARTGGKPDWHEKAAVLELDAVIWSRSKHLPIVVLAKRLEGLCDLDRIAPGDAVQRCE